MGRGAGKGWCGGARGGGVGNNAVLSVLSHAGRAILGIEKG